MGDRLTSQSSPTPYGDVFDELCPHYLAMGMPYDLYWNGEVGTKTAYRKAYQVQMENNQRFTDFANWNLGQYLIAVLQAAPVTVNGFVPKGWSMKDYPDKPFLESQKEEEKKKKDEEYRREKEEDQQKIAMAMFQAMVSSFNKNVEKRNAEKERMRKDQSAGQ